MSFLGRARLLVKTSVGAVLAPAEDPRQSFAFAYQRQRELLAKVQSSLADVRASGERVDARAKELEEMLPALQEQARSAVIGGREDLARLALRRRQACVAQLEGLREQRREIEREEGGLALIEQRLATQIEAFYARQEVIAARYSAAEAQVRINEALTGVSQELSDLGDALERAEASAETMRARASAIDELMETGVLGSPADLSGDFAVDLDGEVERQLEAIAEEFKRRLR